MSRLLLRLVVRWETLLVVAIIGVSIWSTTLSPFFLTRINLLDLITPYVFIGLMALGLTFVVIAGEIDISVTAILAVSVVSFAQLLDHGLNVWIAALVGLVVAAALGLVNGALVALLNLPSLAVTLGTLAAYQGLAFVVLSGEGVAEFPQGYLDLGGGYIHNELPVALVVLVVAPSCSGPCSTPPASAGTCSRSATTGRQPGSPASRRRASGSRSSSISGFMAGIAGIAYVGFFGSARADAAQGSLLDVVTAVVLGGVNIFGGAGSMLGVLPGADPRRGAAERDAAREPRRRHPEHRHRRAPAGGHRRRQPRSEPHKTAPRGSGSGERRWSGTTHRRRHSPVPWNLRLRKEGK